MCTFFLLNKSMNGGKIYFKFKSNKVGFSKSRFKKKKPGHTEKTDKI